MSYSISTLLTRNLHNVSVKTTPRVGARLSTKSIPKMACFTTPPRARTVAVTKSIASLARSGLLTLTFDISQLPSLRNQAIAGGCDGIGPPW